MKALYPPPPPQPTPIKMTSFQISPTTVLLTKNHLPLAPRSPSAHDPAASHHAAMPMNARQQDVPYMITPPSPTNRNINIPNPNNIHEEDHSNSAGNTTGLPSRVTNPNAYPRNNAPTNAPANMYAPSPSSPPQTPRPPPSSPSSLPFNIPNADRRYRASVELRDADSRLTMSYPKFRQNCGIELQDPGFQSSCCTNCGKYHERQERASTPASPLANPPPSAKVYGGDRSAEKGCDGIFCSSDCRTNFMLQQSLF